MEEAKTWHVTEHPTRGDVYEVLISIHGVQHPKLHDLKIYSYYDGVDTWGAWEFSRDRALRALPNRKFKPLGWREVRG